MGSTRQRHHRGFAMVYLHLALLVTLALFVSLAVDFGHVQAVKNELQLAADAAARAAAASLSSGTTVAQNAAVTVASYNKADMTAVTLNPSTDVQFGTWSPTARTFAQLTGSAAASANAVKVITSRTGANGVSLTWGSLGKLINASSTGTCSVRVQAIACSTGVSGQCSLIGVNSITVSGNGFTDSYDATKGAYNSATAKKNGSIASNGNISLSGSAKVNGDARCGVGKTTTLQGSAKVTGLNAPMASDSTYPSVTMPKSYIDLGDVNMTSGTTSIPGGTYVIHNLTLGGSSHIIWTGPTTLYITNSYNITGNSTIDTYQNLPINRKLYFLPTCKTATWTGTNDCVGELYAPDTDFTIGGSVDLYGRVTAKTISLSSNGGMHYDESLTPPGGTNARASVTLVQ